MKDITKPNFFIIGAPRSGTTSLSSYLSDHPDIYFSDVKETGFFHNGVLSHKHTTIKDYMEICFSGTKDKKYKAVGEGTTSYLSSKKAVERVLEFNPDAKFIAMLRNPVDMMYSLYLHNRKNNPDNFIDDWENNKIHKNIANF